MSIKTMGDAGMIIRNGRLVIGQMPQITMFSAQEDDNGNGIGPKRPILDMNPTIINFADLIEALLRQNDNGYPTEFIGHIFVRPTAKDERIMLTDDGKVALDSYVSPETN